MNTDATSTLPQAIRLGRAICGDLEQAERREWWLTNGRGAYAAGTVAGTLTRRYHGLLIAPLDPPLGRYLVFVKADAVVTDGERSWPLFSNRWGGGAVDPAGHVRIESFHLDGRMPVWRFDLGDVTVESRVWMEQGSDTTYVAYRLVQSPAEATRTYRLRVRLLVNARDHHSGTPRHSFAPHVEGSELDGQGNTSLRVRHPADGRGERGGYTLVFRVRGGHIAPASDWIDNFDLPIERERGLSDIDSHLCVGEADLELRSDRWSGLVASVNGEPSPYLDEALARHRSHDSSTLTRARVQVRELLDAPAWIHQLVLAADSFVFSRPITGSPDGESVIAGYPWFGDWGRDTMIALPGLTLATGRYDSARRILETFALFVDGGMLPNVFPGDGTQAEYNTVDAALWYIEAWRAYVEVSGDLTSLREVFPVLESIIAFHRDGTRYRIGMDSTDGLLHAGEPGVQLTWMDAKIGDWVVTPRTGKPVEINALWYNALSAMALLATLIGRSGAPYERLAKQARIGFQRYLRGDGGGLFDVLDGPSGNDATIRPNQIFAVSLPASPLDPGAQLRVVNECARELLTSYGLRSLAPEHTDFRDRYVGGVWERDGGYHQGPVWAWLLGHYAIAEHRIHGDAARAQSRLEAIRDHLLDAALGSVSEIFDGAPPHDPRGAPAQAWSVACVLEAWWRLERQRLATPIGKDKAKPRRQSPAKHTTGSKKRSELA
ncbi:MAG: amylo-alpha-1,6-glucosidase [Gammaproteobacteria bacterium]|nr:amylo-alpha-1,6-glucosidase [Gammaproteobacteria bacterium]